MITFGAAVALAALWLGLEVALDALDNSEDKRMFDPYRLERWKAGETLEE